MAIPIDYKLTNKGDNDLKFFDDGDNVRIVCRNGNNVKIPISQGPSANVDKVTDLLKPVQNNGGTSGFKAEGATSIYLGSDKFLFSSKVKLDISIDGKGHAQQKEFDTEDNTPSIEAPDGLIALDVNDPAKVPMDFRVLYQVSNTDAQYTCRINFIQNNGAQTPIPWGYDGGVLPLTPGAQTIIIVDNIAEALNVIFDFEAIGMNPGDSFKMVTELITIDTAFNANADNDLTLYYEEENDCIVDDEGVQVTDESGSCITDESTIPEIPEFTCGGASQGVPHNGRRFLGAVENSSNQWAAIKSKLDDPSYVPQNIGGIGLAGMKNFSTGTSTQMLISYRTYTTLNTIAEPLFMRFIFRCNELNREFVVLWTTDPEPAVNNHGYDRTTWNLLGSVKNESSINQIKDLDLAAMGKPGYVRIIVTTINDYNNDSIDGTILDDNYFELQSEEIRRCL